MPKKSRAGDRVGVYVFITFAALALSALMVTLTNCETQPPQSSSAPPRQTTLSPDQSQSPPPSPQTTGGEVARRYEVELSDGQVSSLAAIALHEYAQEVDARFLAPDTLELTATVLRDNLLSALEDGGAAAAIARGLLPESFEATVAVELYAQEGTLKVEIVEAAALGIDIAEYIPAGVEGKLNDVIAEVLPDSAVLCEVEVSDGTAKFIFEL